MSGPDPSSPELPARPPLPELSHALVHAGGQCTRYLRIGSGRPVLVLATMAEPLPPHVADVVTTLAGIRRVLLTDGRREADDRTPERCRARFPLAGWLPDFLDGLGVERVDVVVVLEFALQLADFVGAHPTRVRQVVLLAHPIARNEDVRASVRTLRGAGCAPVVLSTDAGALDATRSALVHLLGAP